jgi:fucose permease
MSPGYRRDWLTWAAFSALFAFGFLNSALGPSLPYIRAEEGISYFAGAVHQAAFAVGGGLAGVLASRQRNPRGRSWTICGGLAGAALAGIALGYGTGFAVTVAAAFAMSLLGTSALIRVWAMLADRHGRHRTVAMTEGEVAVSLSGIVTALLVGGFAATALSWRFAFVVGAGLVAVAVAAVALADVPPEMPRLSTPDQDQPRVSRGSRVPATLVLVFAIVALEFSLSFWLASFLNDSVRLARGVAASMVSALYAANLVGRLVASRLAGVISAERLLAGALVLCLAGLPILLTATTGVAAAVGLSMAGAAIGAMFPLTSSLHVGASERTADRAMGQILAVAALGQVLGPLGAGLVAQTNGLRLGLLVLPALVLLAGAALVRHRVPSR